MAESFTPTSGLLGGLLIGASAALLLLLNGRVAGVSGIVAGLLGGRPGGWQAMFALGLLLGALGYGVLAGGLAVDVRASVPVMAVAGLLVGFGARLGSGCTSGHGVCGLARLSARSVVATAVFMSAAFATVFVVRHVL
ncbi:protein of unknown function DUF395, YeeE/YedE [Rubrobacter xylanophilus DSM 9941]|uniref:Uncharacterized protein n=1 Tax=Rubrobacter xylanophilus (strain DSM 9941 / JCM 11954 / NBRC 16129 / PRD-1) TaxID=266117 RepID=Q1AVJ9_RUBXD|nr:YeeE/YedE thiosulfate transporter family protein [Rubrobacter xylanophilus]ABG04579.1 protein of unknown function DUF395, YeeE/YedE [Rubrobacter xylanophilus DSM 9941]